MSVLNIIGFEDLPPVGDYALYETLLKGLARQYTTQNITTVQRNGRQWLRMSGTTTTPSGYSTARAASLMLDLNTPALKTTLMTKKVWIGYRYCTVLTGAAQIPTSATIYFGAGFTLPTALLVPADIPDNTEFFLEFGIDWANKLVEIWRDGTLLKTVAIPGWADASYSAYNFVIGYVDQDYAGSASVAYARQFDINDFYMVIEDGVGLSKRLGALKVKPMVIESVELGDGWGNPSVGDPTVILSQKSLTTAGKLTPVLRSSTKHSPLKVNFAKPAVDGNIEYVAIDVIGFRDAGTVTKFSSKIKADTVESAAVTGIVAPAILTVSAVYAGEKTPNNTRWTPDNFDTMDLSINSLAEG